MRRDRARAGLRNDQRRAPGPIETLWIYVVSTIAIVILTAIYTTLGGIKAVIWTDFIQASIMIGSALIALGLLYFAIPGGWHEIVERHGGFDFGFLHDRARSGETRLGKIERHVRSRVHDFRRPDRLDLHHHGHARHRPGHGATDVDRADIRRSRRSLILSGLADIPIAFTFLTIGLLLWVYYQAHPDPTLPKTPNEIFCHYILYEMPVGLRGLLIAGIFATAMGSLSTAINALATSFTRDWYQPYINPRSTAEQSLRAVRWATVWFSILMIVVASTTSYFVIVHPNVRIIPIVLGIFGYTYGSLLGIFLCGMFTKRRGNDLGNILAMIVGFIVVAILSGLPNNIAGLSAVSCTRSRAGCQ